jgi:hypothetical protein
LVAAWAVVSLVSLFVDTKTTSAVVISENVIEICRN